MEFEEAVAKYFERIVKELTADFEKGTSLTNCGPAPFAGDILANPDLVWTGTIQVVVIPSILLRHN